MGKTIEKIAQNIAGRFYVDVNCINCSLCAEIACDIFETNHEEGWEFVKRQPQTKEEFELVEEAISLCPVNAIHDSEKKKNKPELIP